MNLKNNLNIKKVSYAASFGVDNWEFSQKEGLACHELIQRFNAVSVREASGIYLCNEFLKTEAHQVLDPTMLLDIQDYISLVREEGESKSAGSLMIYVLDKTGKKEKFIASVAKKLKLKPYTVMQKEKLTGTGKIEDCIYPPVTKWLRGFMDAEFVITDSFHGCAFAILFNKPFIALGNYSRGITRFKSLLNLFDLEERFDELTQDL